MFDLLRRRGSRTQRPSDPATSTEPATDPVAGLHQPPVQVSEVSGLADALAAGDLDAAVGAVAGSTLPSLDRARVELQVRHELFRRAAQGGAELPALPQVARRASGTPAPECQAADLNVATVREGVLGSGSLIVRGLFDEQTCAGLRDQIDAGMAHFEGRERSLDPNWFAPLSDLTGDPAAPDYRRSGYVIFDGTVLAADAPPVAVELLRLFRETGVADIARDYLGEAPALTLQKWVLRRVAPVEHAGWHQDGAFMGTDLRALNLWVALSDCGVSAPSLEIVDRPFDRVVPTGTPGAYFDWDVAPDVVDAERGEAAIEYPVFRAGDAIFFDHLTLHRTGVKPGMTQDRYALESWFFAPSSYPPQYAGLLV